MDKLKKKVIDTIKKYNLIESGDKIVLAVSGGPDSICMLDIFIEIRKSFEQIGCDFNPEPLASFGIVVAHVNHMIRKDAKDDEIYVKNYCEKNNIDFYSKSIDVGKLANNNKIGTEEAGRMVRYEFFDEILEKTNSNKIAIAHNKNDNAETIIMNAIRGSGVSGLKGIEAKRGKYIRPLIKCERTEIEEYCKERKLDPRIDRTNFENEYTRNKIRNIVIPYIEQEFNPNIIETLNRLSDLVIEEETYINRQVKNVYNNILIEESVEDLKNAKSPEIVLDLRKFNNEEKVIKSRILLYTITRLLGSSKGIEKIHIEDVIKLCSNNIGNKYLTPNKNIKILIKNHKIYFLSQV